MEKITCIICNNQNNFNLVGKKGILHKGGQLFNVTNVICNACGLVFINPRPSEEEYRELYKKYGEERHSLRTKDEIISFIKFCEAKSKGAQIAEFISPCVSSGDRVLDIGAGVGLVARALRDELGLRPLILEPDQLLAETAGNYFNLEFFAGTLDDFMAKETLTKFDVLILHHVFEHFGDPVARLRDMAKLLNPNGIFYLEVPNILDFKKPVNQFFDLLHPYSYSLPTLNQILKLGGFKIIARSRDKHWRLQIIAAPKNDPRKELIGPTLNPKNIAFKTKLFLAKRRLIDLLKLL